jgi:heme/copper-type cytochrome/quinol oxidase subunit 2
MRGRLTVVSQESFDDWLADKFAEQERSEFTPSAGEEE